MSRRAIIHYFTGTGNTLRAGELIAMELRAAGYEVSFLPVGRSAPVSDETGEALNVFAFPIYACGMPHTMHEYLGHLPRAQTAGAAVICTMGEEIMVRKDGRRAHIPGFEGHALVEAAGILKRRGYDVFFTDACSYPLNWTQAVSAPKPDICAELQARGDEQATSMGKRITAGEISIRRFGRAHLLWTLPFDRLFAIFGRRGSAKLYVSDGSCTSCGFCARVCPVAAIRLVRGRPRWSMRCEGCQRCINTCPRNAIQTSWFRLIVELAISVAPIPLLALRLANGHRAILFGMALNPWVEVLLWTTAYCLSLPVLDHLLGDFELIPGLRRLVRLSFTKRYRRYLEPHFRPSKE